MQCHERSNGGNSKNANSLMNSASPLGDSWAKTLRIQAHGGVKQQRSFGKQGERSWDSLQAERSKARKLGGRMKRCKKP